MKDTPTLEDLKELALRDPIVYYCITRWRRGECTLEEALLSCVVAMVERNVSQEKVITEYINTHASPPIPNRWAR